MTKLQTLKDLNSDAYFEEGCAWRLSMLHKGDIKQEAIKYFKAIKEKRKELYDLATISWNQGQQYFIKHFFNITDEDLK